MESSATVSIIPSRGLIFALACLVAGGLMVSSLSRKKRHWNQEAARIKKLIIYPIKSVPGVEVDCLLVAKTGVSYGDFNDRSILLINKENRMITLRHSPQLALIKTAINEDGTEITVQAEGMNPLTLKPKKEVDTTDEIVPLVIWSSKTEGVVLGQGSAEWFSKFLGQEVRLLQHLPNFKMRPTERSTTSGKMNDHKVPIMFQDACPVYLITEASIESANVLREEGSTWHFDHASFRPNIVVEDSGADEEENWECLRINQIVFKNVRISDKCAVTTVDKERGVKDDSRLDVLKKRRKVTSQYEKKNYSGDKALFGINLAPDSSGLIKRGMKIDVSLKQATS